MRIETVIPESDRKKIEKYQEKIQERMESYFDDIDSSVLIPEQTKIIQNMGNDLAIKLYEKCIEDVYTYMVPQTILIAENEEDKKILEGLIRKDDSYRKWKQNQEQ